MTATSPKLHLPLIAEAQAMKHVTHNEALAKLDALTQLTVETFQATSPPTAPTQGACFVVAVGATGDWAGQEGLIAQFLNQGWQYITPQEGWRAWGVTEGELRAYTGGTWVQVVGQLQNLDYVGINTTADTTNRLALASQASLFSHDGAGHQVKINKAAAPDTASVLFQTNWAGHAEMGLNGSNAWSVKTSPDGTAWTTSLEIDPATNTVAGAVVQAGPDDVAPGRLMRTDYGYSRGNVVGTVGEAAGVPTGAVVERGANANGEYTRFADGTQICWSAEISATITTAVGAIYRSTPASWVYPATFSQKPFVSGGGVNNASFFWVTAGQANTTYCKSAAFCYTNVTNRAYSLCAVGRWF